MLPHLSEYHRPTDLAEALRLLTRPTPCTVPLAGGAWLVARRDPSIHAVVDLSSLNLAFVKKSARRVRMGAMTTLQTLVDHPHIQELAGGLLAEAAQRSAPPAIRNVATLGGTLVVDDATSEVLLALLVLEGRAVIRSPIGRGVELEAFLADHVAHLPPYALITEVYLPTPPAGAGAALAEISRTPGDRPIVNAAALVVRRGRVCHSARLALGGTAAYPIRLPDLEAMLPYQRFDADLLARASQAISAVLEPAGDFRASAEYRRQMAAVVAARALQQAWEQAGEE
jgi:CO/xanthine dehydrogenase FAD-binding subunit